MLPNHFHSNKQTNKETKPKKLKKKKKHTQKEDLFTFFCIKYSKFSHYLLNSQVSVICLS